MEQQKLPPGFRFSPTDEELVVHYLKNRACGKDYHQGVIAEVDIYKHEPWDLPEKSALPSPDPVWYFFNAQDNKHSHSARINRTTSKGYWKATGKDRKVCSGPHTVGIKKTLIYYEGRAPSGKRTDWIMHEYKLDEDYERRSKVIWSSALCRIRKKGGPGPRNGEQFGASVYNENSEWGEDVDDAVDENVPLPSSHRSDVAASLIKIPKEEAGLDTHTKSPALNDLPDTHTESPALNDLPHVESVDTGTELDLYMFLDNFLTDIPEITSLETDIVSSTLAMDRVQRGQSNFNFNETPADVERHLGLDGTNVHDFLHPALNEEQILGELFQLTDGSQGHTSMTDLSFQSPLCTDVNLCSDGVDSNGVFGDYIEMDDMDSPLDSFVLRSPSYYGIEQQQLSPGFFDEVEGLGCSADLLNAQGLATRRVRLQITPSVCATQRNVPQRGPLHKEHSDVPGSSGLTIQIDSQNIMNSGSGSDSNDNIGRSSVEGCFGKDSLALKTTNFINKVKVQPAMSNAVSFSPSLLSTTGCMKEASLDCEAGLETKGGPHATNASKHSSQMHEVGLDCEAGSSSAVLPGKPVAHLFPSKDYANPYRSLRSGVVSSLCRLGLAVLVLLFLFLGIHMLSKYMLLLLA
ncbi:hypothetical protein GOP47_0000193 [Adiantum capillus-veneris]|uniref:NAC domain-containing protein n=1 Tax=Adiantum capillus-veneris TaxID=13818 RepID=A0A9D4ZQC3_ADICA|nr:hypothetical protein GOP47_0000193 [Adiantum capillus-veneris]